MKEIWSIVFTPIVSAGVVQNPPMANVWAANRDVDSHFPSISLGKCVLACPAVIVIGENQSQKCRTAIHFILTVQLGSLHLLARLLRRLSLRLRLDCLRLDFVIVFFL
jgi:hypothetical protein